MGWNDHIDASDIESEIRMEVADLRGLDEPIPECNHPDRASGSHSKDCEACQFDAWVYEEALRRHIDSRI